MTVAGEFVVYFVFPALVVMLTAFISFAVWVAKSIGVLNQGLAILVRDVNPPDEPSLRELVTDLRIAQGRTLERAGLRDDPPIGYGRNRRSNRPQPN